MIATEIGLQSKTGIVVWLSNDLTYDDVNIDSFAKVIVATIALAIVLLKGDEIKCIKS